MRRLITTAALTILLASACGQGGSPLTFELSLISGYVQPSTPDPSARTNWLAWVVAITNHSASSAQYPSVPQYPGYEIRNAKGELVAQLPAENSPFSGCLDTGSCDPRTIASGASIYLTYYVLGGAGSLGWAFTDMSMQPVLPGTYEVRLVLPSGDLSTPAHFTVCEFKDGSGEYMIANDPCTTQDVANQLGMGTVACGQGLTCTY